MGRRRIGEDDVNLEDNKGIRRYDYGCVVGGSSPDPSANSQGKAQASAEDGAIHYGAMRARDQERFKHRQYEPDYIDELEKS